MTWFAIHKWNNRLVQCFAFLISLLISYQAYTHAYSVDDRQRMRKCVHNAWVRARSVSVSTALKNCHLWILECWSFSFCVTDSMSYKYYAESDMFSTKIDKGQKKLNYSNLFSSSVVYEKRKKEDFEIFFFGKLFFHVVRHCLIQTKVK